MRLAFDLGLHLDMAPYVVRGTIPPENAEVRRMTFWAVYMSEQQVSLTVLSIVLANCSGSGGTTWVDRLGAQWRE